MKEKYKKLRDEFHQQRDELKSQITKYKTAVEEHNRKISKLEEEIENNRPRTPKGEVICKSCDVTSMEFIRSYKAGSYSFSGVIKEYKCQLCDDIKEEICPN